MGGDYDYGEKGKIEGLWRVDVPVSSIDLAREFYVDTLYMRVTDEDTVNERLEISVRGGGRVTLFVPREGDHMSPGIRTGIVFRAESIYDFHRRMVDEGVIFLRKPERMPWGDLVAEFEDLDGNRFTVLDVPDPEQH